MKICTLRIAVHSRTDRCWAKIDGESSEDSFNFFKNESTQCTWRLNQRFQQETMWNKFGRDKYITKNTWKLCKHFFIYVLPVATRKKKPRLRRQNIAPKKKVFCEKKYVKIIQKRCSRPYWKALKKCRLNEPSSRKVILWGACGERRKQKSLFF